MIPVPPDFVTYLLEDGIFVGAASEAVRLGRAESWAAEESSLKHP